MSNENVMRNVSQYEMNLMGNMRENYAYQPGTVDDTFTRDDGGNPRLRWIRNRPVEQLVRGLLYSFQSFPQPQYFQRIYGFTDEQARYGISQDTRLTYVNFNVARVSPFTRHDDRNMTPDEVAVWMAGGQ